jgi:hypothetical protein
MMQIPDVWKESKPTGEPRSAYDLTVAHYPLTIQALMMQRACTLRAIFAPPVSMADSKAVGSDIPP